MIKKARFWAQEEEKGKMMNISSRKDPEISVCKMGALDH